MRIKLKNIALTGNRFRVPNRTTTDVASSMLKILVTELMMIILMLLIKIDLKGKRELQNHSKREHDLFKGPHFDGRKDSTLVLKKLTKNIFEEP